MAAELVVKTLDVDGAGFCVNVKVGDASGGETIVAAVAGKSHYVTSIIINTVAAITVTIQDNTAATPVVLLGPVNFAATSGSPHTVNFLKAVKVTAGNLIEIDASGAGLIQCTIQGYTR